MPASQTRLLLIAFAILLPFRLLGEIVLTRPILPVAALDFAHAAVHPIEDTPAGVPVILRVSIRNPTTQPLKVSVLTPGDYLTDDDFQVVLRSKTNSFTCKTSNGQQPLSFERPHIVDVAPQADLVTPLSIGDVPEGEYEGELRWISSNGTPRAPEILTHFKLVVTPDTAASRKRWLDKRVGEIRTGDIFAGFLAMGLPQPALLDTLIADLEGTDVARRDNAAMLFGAFDYFGPVDFSDSKRRLSILAALTPNATRESPAVDKVVGRMMGMFMYKPDDAWLPVLLRYADGGGETQATVCMGLQSFDEPAAEDCKLRWAGEPDSLEAGIAIESLVRDGDKRGVPFLADIVLGKSGPPSNGPGAPDVEELLCYMDVLAARDAIAALEKSGDPAKRQIVQYCRDSSFAPDTKKMPIDDAVGILLRVNVFTPDGRSSDADVRAGRAAARNIFKKFTAINRMLREGTPAAQLYALCLLSYEDEFYFNRASNRLKQSRDVIQIIEANHKYQLAMPEAIAAIKSRRFAQNLLQFGDLVPSPPATFPTTAP